MPNEKDNKSNSAGSSRHRGNDNASEKRDSGNSERGFAAMDPEKQRQIASEGGKASHGGQGKNANDKDSGVQRGGNRSGGSDKGKDDKSSSRSATSGNRSSTTGSGMSKSGSSKEKTGSGAGRSGGNSGSKK